MPFWPQLWPLLPSHPPCLFWPQGPGLCSSLPTVRFHESSLLGWPQPSGLSSKAPSWGGALLEYSTEDPAAPDLYHFLYRLGHVLNMIKFIYLFACFGFPSLYTHENVSSVRASQLSCLGMCPQSLEWCQVHSGCSIGPRVNKPPFY